MANTLGSIEFRLASLLREVTSLRIGIAAKGKTPKPGDRSTLAHFDRLQAIGDSLELMLRHLKSMEHVQLLRADRIHDLPREARYGERQSIDGKLAEIQRVRALAQRLAAELRACYDDSMRPTTADLIEGTQKLLNELGKSIDRQQLQATVHKVSDRPSFVNSSPASTPGLSAADALSQVWLLQACAIALTRKRRQ